MDGQTGHRGGGRIDEVLILRHIHQLIQSFQFIRSVRQQPTGSPRHASNRLSGRVGN
jgi:hypothetical protein